MVSTSLEAGSPAVPRELPRKPRRSRPFSRGWQRVAAGGSALFFLTAAGSLAVMEAKSSRLQSEFFAHLAGQMTYRVDAGPSDAILFPTDGPYDRRLGYIALPEIISGLRRQDFAVERQARISEQFGWYFERSGIAPYREKTQAGLTLLDRDGREVFAARTPEHAFENFDAVPQVLINTLLFIENRELLTTRFPRANPAIEWDRLATAFADLVVKKATNGGQSPGGSTLATQMEKFRHSPDGRTENVTEKFRQMVSATLRGYLEGENTGAARRQIVVDYINSTPLAARPGFGEIIGLGDGLWAWFGTDFAAVRALGDSEDPSLSLQQRGAVYRQALSLLIAQRRPSEYLITRRSSLQSLVDSYLRLLAEAGIIDEPLRDAALAQPARFADELMTAAPPASHLSWKAASSLRTRLLGQLGLGSLYDLDRLDLTVETTLDRPVQEGVTAALRGLANRESLETLGLAEHRLLDRGDPAKVIYSLVLYERAGGRNLLRVQADNFDGPFDINEGTKLDLGSTAKLRTLVTYLEVIAELSDRLRGEPNEVLHEKAAKGDPLTRWVAGRLLERMAPSLPVLLEDAMQRRYSASPHERFFTGGGLHHFVNFDKADNGRVISVSEALQHSVNLVFIRLMRDIVSYHVAQIAEEGDPRKPDSPLREEYLSRFADREGREFLLNFYSRYRDLDSDQILATLTKRARGSLSARTVVFRSLRPEAGVAELAAYLRAAGGKPLSDDDVQQLYDAYGVDRFPLNDRGYIAKIHPLELWLAAYLSQAPRTSFAEVAKAGADARQAAYSWLFKPKLRKAQDTRIRTLLEEEAFRRIALRWQRVGYPFDWLVPSYATSIGSSGDRPAALAELMGIIANDGLRLPTGRFERLRFAEETPFETTLKLARGSGERVLRRDVALTLRRALIDTVEQGTGRRVSGVFRGPDGEVLAAGGKTGTGDHRFERFGSHGELISSQVVNRTATFVFFLGDRFFGVVSAHVAGSDAADYGFTSALPTQLLKSLAPMLQPLLERAPADGSDPIESVPDLMVEPLPEEPAPAPLAEGDSGPALGAAGPVSGQTCERAHDNRWRCDLTRTLQADAGGGLQAGQ